MSIIGGRGSGRPELDVFEPVAAADYSERNRAAQRLRDYGLTPEAYVAMLESQDARCLICKRATALVVDHDHEDGHVRGLLCMPCNWALGQIRDDPAVADAMAAYLRRDREP